ncbi:hypothetical protein [Lacticaseibacillus rhamnosus]|uniref:hypothetical protein n=1 Tax=Lacticaseibacillus rhamnosus TaxID=47715 RepID=UPI000ADFCC08|nr:hypothetical protein [Lacticaseibacillus rhamnosus]
MKKPSRHNPIQHDGLKLASTKDYFLYLPFLNFFIGTTRPTVDLLSFLLSLQALMTQAPKP